MALSRDLQSQIVSLTNAHWSEHVHDESFSELIAGKEPVHRMADFVDDRTCSLLKVNLDTRYEGDKRGNPKKRSMGDIWVRSQGIYNPVNVKAGLQGVKGQPNVVSMQKLLDYTFKRWIDSYYLLILKFDLSSEDAHKLYFVDLLEWIDFATYDAGPGQIMLREQMFYDKVDAGHIPECRSIYEKVDVLLELFEEGIHALMANRKGRLSRQRKLGQEFQQSDFAVDQSQMIFVP